jgi:Dolichyl-phosphate-mannose-protein mannosyltransferase
MENASAIEADRRENRKNLVLSLAVVVFLAFACFMYAYVNRIWLAAFQQVVSWLTNPTINFVPIQIQGVPLAFVATVEILMLGAVSSYTLLSDEKDSLIKFISALGMGAGFTGLITIVLGIFGNLFQLPLNIAVIFLCSGLILVNIYRHRGKEKPSERELLRSYFAVGKLRRPSNLGLWLIACLAISTIFFLCFYHAFLTVIVHWDATVYHAVMPVLMFENHGFPLLAGPSIGIEMSANFPPLFPALGAFYYIQMGLVEDFYLRAIPPVMGILAVLATYKIGEVLAGKKYGVISALFLAITPLFFRYSTYATSYSLLTFFGSVSVLFLFLAISREDTKYWILSGIFYGFTLLTSYIALYLAPFFVITLIYYFIEERRGFRLNVKLALLLGVSVLIIGGVWYLRNLVLLGNPVYPNGYTVLGGINIDPLIMETTNEGIKRSAVAGFFGGDVPLLEKISIFITYKIHFPSISFLTIAGIALLPTQSKKFWLVLAWPLTLSIAILGGLTWGFPRHIVITLP